jgi:catechol 2,3-dioxygenase-like lactoylglutathione lyase family enzyme
MRYPAARFNYANAAAYGAVVLSCILLAVGSLHAKPNLPVETSLDHVGFQVADIDRSIRFYADYFGFRLTRRAEYAFNGTQTDIKDADLTAAFMHLGSTALELIQLRKPVGELGPGQTKSLGVFHLGLYIKDVRAAYKQLTDVGVKFNTEPRLRDGVYTASLRDPDGVTLELMEIRSSTSQKGR